MKIYSLFLCLSNIWAACFCFSNRNHENSPFGYVQLEHEESLTSSLVAHSDACQWQQSQHEDCSKTSLFYRTINGYCNNIKFPLRGTAVIPFKRVIAPQYGNNGDLRKAKNGDDLPSAREVSRKIHEGLESTDRTSSVMLMQWGQFLDHDITHTPATTQLNASGSPEDVKCGEDGCNTASHPACKPIAINSDDAAFATKQCLKFVRSEATKFDITCSPGKREQINQITAYIDGSNIYGSSSNVAQVLRSEDRKGELKVSSHQTNTGNNLKPLLPQQPTEKCADSTKTCDFVAGDLRVNEQPALTAMHTIWARQHNAIAKRISSINLRWNSDRVYREARKIVGAMLQHITYNEFLPNILNKQELTRWHLDLNNDGYFTGYDEEVDASIANVFATAAFRFGHSLVPSFLKRGKNKPDVPLSEVFFQPKFIADKEKGGVDGFMQGVCQSGMQKMDTVMTKQITNHLFAKTANGVGHDLAALNLQRGRDHGLPGYNDWRTRCDLPRLTSFDSLTDAVANTSVVLKLQQLYSHVDDIDLFTGAMAEKPLKGGILGPTFSCLVGRQFNDLRKGDRFWYENQAPQGFTKAQLKELRKVRLSHVICDMSDHIDKIQPWAMEVPFRQAFTTRDCATQSKYSCEEFNRLWDADHNSKKSCDSLGGQIDWSKWLSIRKRLNDVF